MMTLKKTIGAIALAGVSFVAVAAGVQASEKRPAELAPLGEPPAPADNQQHLKRLNWASCCSLIHACLATAQCLALRVTCLKRAGISQTRSLWDIREQPTGATHQPS